MENKFTLTFEQTLPLMLTALNNNHTPALIGEAGIGKSSLVEDLARVLKTKVFVLPVNQLADRADITGARTTQDAQGNWSQTFFPHFMITEAVAYANDNPDETPVLFLDEFNRASEDITSAVLSLQTLRRIGDTHLPDNLKLVVAGNDTGNIVSIDEATVTRFVLYHVKPDINTFMSIQKLNPFVKAVLDKNPNELISNIVEFQGLLNNNAVDEDEDSEEFEFADLEFGNQGFTQLTVPRTITYLSEFLDSHGIDGSGSDKEKEILGQLLIDTGSNDATVLLIAMMGYTGETNFTWSVYQEIQNHFNQLISGNTTSAPQLASIRPKQDYINSLSKSQDSSAIEDLLGSFANDRELTEMTVWLIEQESVKEINNNQAVQFFVENALDKIDTFNNTDIQNIMKVLPDPNRVADITVQTMLNSQSAIMGQWKTMIKSIIED